MRKRQDSNIDDSGSDLSSCEDDSSKDESMPFIANNMHVNNIYQDYSFELEVEDIDEGQDDEDADEKSSSGSENEYVEEKV